MGEASVWSPKRLSGFLHLETTNNNQSRLPRLGHPENTAERWLKHILTSALISQGQCPAPLTKLLFVLLALSLCHSSAASRMLQCPDLCTCFSTNSIPPSTGALISIDCSGLGFSQVVIKNVLSPNNSDRFIDENVTPSIKDQMNKTLVIEIFHSHNLQDKKQNGIQYTRFLSNEVNIFDLSNNHLQSLNGEMFSHLESLDYLNVSHNNISLIENTTFDELINLQLLDLSFNNINIFVLDNLHLSDKLSQLLLNNNNIQLNAKSTYVFQYLPQLKTLDLANNPVSEIPLDFFHHSPYLNSLNLANCSIQEIKQNQLDKMKHLEKLNLNHNNIRFISQPLFQETSLKWLSMSAMPNLTTLSHVAFYGLSKLEYLNLSHNPNLYWIQPDLFTPLIELKIVDLSNSGIKYLSEITFFNNNYLQQIFINNNPFKCSCVNAWLAKETHMTHSKLVNASYLECHSDEHVKTSILEADFMCQEVKVHNMTSRVFVPLGSRMLLECKYDSEEAAVIKWTTPSGAVYYHHHFYNNASQHMLSPQDVQPDSDFHTSHYWHDSTSYHSHLSSQNRIMILSDGSLYIDYMMRSDPGPYTCQVSNQFYNQSTSISIFIACKLSGEVKIFAIVVGLLCALGFFTLNVIYVIVTWIARRLVNKRRREIIRQMLENLNAYKTTQIGRIHENYTHQLTRVRNQYHIQRDKLHRNYTSQVTKMKRGCSNQVEKVRDNYNTKLHQLRDYSSNQIVQIRERANNQIVRIRDYGSYQLDKLRETYKLQQQHVLKLLDTMNLDNCRHVVETECMRAESMMYDIDLLGDEERTDSPLSQIDSEYTTAASSPATSLEENSEAGLSRNMAAYQQNNRDYSTSSSEQDIIIEMQTRVDLEPTLTLNIADKWHFDPDHEGRHEYSMKVQCQANPVNKCLFELESETSVLPQHDLEIELQTANCECADNESHCEGSYVTAESSPVRHHPKSQFPEYKLKDVAEKDIQNNKSPTSVNDNNLETDV